MLMVVMGMLHAEAVIAEIPRQWPTLGHEGKSCLSPHDGDSIEKNRLHFV